MDRVNHCRAERTDWSGWRASLVATAAKLGGAYHKSIRLDLWIWLPGFGYYLWLNRIIWLGTEFGTPAGQMRGFLFFVCQGALFWLAVLMVDGLLAPTRSRWRVIFVAAVHVFLASLYLDTVLYRLMALHLGPAVGILFQGGLSRLAINWAHTGIPSGTIGTYAGWGALLVLGVILYSWIMAAPSSRFWSARRVQPTKLGRVALLAAFLLAVCQMLSVSDDHDYQINFAELRKSMPVRFGSPGTKPGRRLVVGGLRPLRDARETANAVEALGLQPGVHPDIFLFVLESARGDFVTPQITPNLARLREESLPFPMGLAAANASHISWYSLLTANHGLYFGAAIRAPLRSGSVPLQLLRGLGYKVNVLCSSTLDYHEIDRLVFGNELQLCDAMFDAQKSGLGNAPTRDLAVTDQLLQALEQPPGNRLFLVFYHSTHHDYDWPAGDPAPFTPYTPRWNYGDFSIGADQLTLIMNRYRNAFHFQDRLIGQVLARLKERGAYENCVLAVTGDHGEEFLEHGKLLHASNLFRPQTSVPFLLRLPTKPMAVAPVSRRFPAATHVDFMPTVLDLLGLTVTNLFDGESLLRKATDEAVIVAENRDSDPVRFCLQSSRCKVFFEYQYERQPTASQRVLYLRQITDLNDVPVKMDLASPQIVTFLRTNFTATLKTLYPEFETDFAGGAPLSREKPTSVEGPDTRIRAPSMVREARK